MSNNFSKELKISIKKLFFEKKIKFKRLQNPFKRVENYNKNDKMVETIV